MNRNHSSVSLNSSGDSNNSNNNNNNNNNNTNNNIKKSNSNNDIDLFQLTSNLNTLSDVSKLMSNSKKLNTHSSIKIKSPEDIKRENDIIANLDPVYFNKDFDSSFILQNIPKDAPIDTIDELTVKISGYHEAVDSRFNDLIRKSYNGFVQGMSQVYEIEKDLTHSARMCSSGKEYLDGIQKNMTAFGFRLLAKHRIKQLSKFMLQESHCIKEISETAKKIDTLLSMNEFSQALDLLNQWNKVITKYSKYICIRDIASNIHVTADVVLDKIDSSLLGVCHLFDPKQFEIIMNSYYKLKQTTRFNTKIHQNFILNIEDHSKKILRTHLNLTYSKPEELKHMKFVEMCQQLKEDQYIPSLMSILEHLSDLMWSHYMMKQWILQKIHTFDGVTDETVLVEKNFYVDAFKLFNSNKKTIWNSIQNQVRHILNSLNPKFKIEYFIKVLDSINQFIEVGNEFSCEEANLLKGIMKEKSLDYFQNFHKETIERLKTMLENEMWHKIPLQSNFTVLDVKEFGIVMNNFNESNSGNGSASRKSSSSKPPAPLISTFLTISEQKPLSFEIEDHNLPFLNHFKDFGNPFSLVDGRRTLSEAAGNNNSGLTPTSLNSSLTDIPTSNNNNAATTSSPLISSTTINVIKQIGYYLQMMKILKQLSYPIFTAISQLLEYYVYSVFSFFGENQQIFDSNNINPMLKKTMQRLKLKFSPVQEKQSLLSASTFQSKMSSPHLSLKNSDNNSNNKSPNNIHLSHSKENIFLPNLTISTDGGNNNSNSNGNHHNGHSHSLSNSTSGGNSLGNTLSSSLNNSNYNGEDEILINWSLPKLSELVDLTQSKNLYGLENKIIGLESMMFLVDCIMEAQPLVLDLIPSEKVFQINNFYFETVSVVASLRNLCYKNITSQFLNLDKIAGLIQSTKWELKEAPTTESNSYITSIIIEFHRFTGLLDEISSKSSLITPKVKNLLWENTITLAMETLIDSYAKLRKCNNFGRNLMIMDLKKLQTNLEKLTTIRPIPHIKHVENYITAFYLPESDLYNLARDSEYTVKQVIGIVQISNHLKKKKELINDLEELEKQRIKENLLNK